MRPTKFRGEARPTALKPLKDKVVAISLLTYLYLDKDDLMRTLSCDSGFSDSDISSEFHDIPSEFLNMPRFCGGSDLGVGRYISDIVDTGIVFFLKLSVDF